MIGSLTDQLGYTPEERADMGAASVGDLYTADSVFEFERTRIFSRSWSLAATTEELAAPGSFVTVRSGGAPLLIVRDQSGTLRAFHNICRHRGITLLEGAGTLGRFMTCPYHQWSYGLDGDLTRVPQHEEQFPALDQCSLGLHGAQVAQWQGLGPKARQPMPHTGRKPQSRRSTEGGSSPTATSKASSAFSQNGRCVGRSLRSLSMSAATGGGAVRPIREALAIDPFDECPVCRQIGHGLLTEVS